MLVIGPFKSIKGNQAKLKVKVRLNLHGIVSIDSTTMLEDEEVEVSVSVGKDSFKEALKMDIDEGITNSSATTAECDVHMHEVKRATDSSSPTVENDVPETEEKSTHMETDTKVREQGSIELQNMEDQAKQKGRGRWSKGPGASFESAIRELPPSAIGDAGHYDAIGFLAANKGKPMKRHCCSYVKSRVFLLRVKVQSFSFYLLFVGDSEGHCRTKNCKTYEKAGKHSLKVFVFYLLKIKNIIIRLSLHMLL